MLFVPFWSPDGESLAFTFREHSHSPYAQVCTIAVDSKKVRYLTPPQRFNFALQWLPDDLIVYQEVVYPETAERHAKAERFLCSMHRDGGQQRRILDHVVLPCVPVRVRQLSLRVLRIIESKGEWRNVSRRNKYTRTKSCVRRDDHCRSFGLVHQCVHGYFAACWSTRARVSPSKHKRRSRRACPDGDESERRWPAAN
jgi:hypothetical protein